MEAESILKPGETCWRIEASRRAAFLVDGRDYFAAFAAAVEQAREQVLVIGWDIDSRTRLRRDGEGGLPRELARFLDEVTRRRRGLNVYVLNWDFVMLYAFDREPLPLVKLGWQTRRAVHFAMDDNHPVGGCHHQKIVVVDDLVAFVGGFDLTAGRWDTSEHLPDDARRNEAGRQFPPFHDVQMMVDGEAAAAIGELARRRWHRATNKHLKPPSGKTGDPWPVSVKPDLENVKVAVVRTDPVSQPKVNEVKRLNLAAIGAARKVIYIENQYLSSWSVGEALAGRLREPDGPEVVIIMPKKCSGWLEETTMGVLRARMLQKLEAADLHDRLRVFYPLVRESREVDVMVHAKVMVIDDRLVRVGSSNLNSRSMGLDTECDLAVETQEGSPVATGILGFRNRLLGEHLGASVEEVEQAIAEKGTLRASIEALRGGERTLEPVQSDIEEWIDDLVPEGGLFDPEQPIALEELMDELAPVAVAQQKASPGRRPQVFFLTGLLAVVMLLTVLWRWTPLSEWADVQNLVDWGETFSDTAAAPLLTLAAFLAGGLIMFPVTVLILATALIFGPWLGFAFAFVGSVGSALLTFAVGRLLGREAVQKLAGDRLTQVSRRLARRGLLAVTAVRIIPVAPFTLINLICGASHIRLRDFLFGTMIGMAPGIAFVTAFEQGLENLLRHPEPENLLLLVGILVVVGGASWMARRWIKRKERSIDGGYAPGKAGDE